MFSSESSKRNTTILEGVDMGTKKLIAVGIDDYEWQPLSCAVNDALDLADLLESHQYNFSCDLIFDDDATRANILAALKSELHIEHELLVMFFAGHGSYDFGNCYICTWGNDGHSGISIDEIVSLVCSQDAKPKSVLIILDCCHSGKAGAPTIATHRLESAHLDKRSFGSLGEGKLLIAACDMIAYEETTTGHGAFTASLLDGLQGGATSPDGLVTATGIYSYICECFARKGFEQQPVLKGDISGQIVLGDGFEALVVAPNPIAAAETHLGRLEKACAEYRAFHHDSLHELQSYKNAYYKQCVIQLGHLLASFGKFNGISLIESQEKRLQSINELLQTELISLGSPTKGYATPVGVIDEKLGTGAFGTVWKVTDKSDGREYAYKIFHVSDLDNADKLRRFERGFKAMEKLEHAFIVKVYKYTECPHGILMQYIHGPNLRQHAAQFETAAQKLQLLIGIGETIQHAHNRGVRHRDLKPENILLDYHPDSDSWRPHLTDFDLAWYSNATQLTNAALGTVQYAAPEQIRRPRSSAAHESRVDVYAFAMIMHFVFTNSDPVPFDYALNRESMRRGLSRGCDGLAAESANLIRDLYEICANEKPEDRVLDFRQIVNTLHDANDQLKSSRIDSAINWDSFCAQLKYECIGLVGGGSDNADSFTTASSRTLVSLEHVRKGEHFSIEIRFYVFEMPIMDGIDNQDIVQKLNKKISDAIKRYSAIRRHGSTSPYEVFVLYDVDKFTLRQVEVVRRMVSDVVDILEGSRL